MRIRKIFASTTLALTLVAASMAPASALDHTVSGVNDVPTQVGDTDHTAYDLDMLALINAERAARGIGPVQLWPDGHNAALTYAVQVRDKVRKFKGNGFAHDTNIEMKMQNWAGCENTSENLFFEVRGDFRKGTLTPSAQHAMDTYMASDYHRMNVLDPNVKYVSLGTLYNPISGELFNTQRYHQQCSVDTIKYRLDPLPFSPVVDLPQDDILLDEQLDEEAVSGAPVAPVAPNKPAPESDQGEDNAEQDNAEQDNAEPDVEITEPEPTAPTELEADEPIKLTPIEPIEPTTPIEPDNTDDGADTEQPQQPAEPEPSTPTTPNPVSPGGSGSSGGSGGSGGAAPSNPAPPLSSTDPAPPVSPVAPSTPTLPLTPETNEPADDPAKENPRTDIGLIDLNPDQGVGTTTVTMGDKIVSLASAGQQVVAVDTNGDGIDEVVVRDGNKLFTTDGTTTTLLAAYGRSGDELFVGNWGTNNSVSIAVRRGNTFYVKDTISGGEADRVFDYGRNGDKVLVGDWNNDGIDTFAVRRGNVMYLNNQFVGGNAEIVFSYGRINDIVHIGDWDGDGKATPMVQRDSTLYFANGFNGGQADYTVTLTSEQRKAMLVVGSFDGSKRDTIGFAHMRR